MTEPLIARIEALLKSEGGKITNLKSHKLLREALQELKELEADRLEHLCIQSATEAELEGADKVIANLKVEIESLQNHRCGWLIENGKTQGHGLKYQTFDPDTGMFTWTEDVYKALHFSRRADAELIAQESPDAWKIVEHAFVTAIERDLE